MTGKSGEINLVTLPVAELILQEMERFDSLHLYADAVLLVCPGYPGKEPFPQVGSYKRMGPEDESCGLYLLND